jgi:hypothetical protein
MKDVYSGARHVSRADAPLVVKELQKIEHTLGRCTTRELATELVERSRDKQSPTHGLFEWVDKKAAEEYRIEKAIQIIASIYVVFEEQPERPPVRAFPVVTHDGKKGPYPLRKVLESKDLTAMMLEEAQRDMKRFMVRFDGLKELADVFAAMRSVVKKKAG